jgi:hypothetical protein
MQTAFLLRFQESCVSNDTDSVECGTQTQTKGGREQADSDPSSTGYCFVPPSAKGNGTQTQTRAPREAADTFGSHAVLNINCPQPKLLGTTTVTNVRAEIGDRDPQQASQHVLPTLAQPNDQGTKTKTWPVKREDDDKDHHRQSLNVIPKCS